MKLLKINVFNLYISLILLLPISTLFQGINENINKFLFVFIFFIQLVYIFSTKINFKYVVFMFFSIVMYVFGLFNTSNIVFSNDIIYFINWLIFSTVICNSYDKLELWIKGHEKFITTILILWSIIVFISIFLPIGWYYKEGGIRYFGSLCGSIFRLGPSAMFILILALSKIVYFNKKKALYFCFLPVFCGLMGSSRTYAILLLFLFFIALYFCFENKRLFLIYLIPIVFFIILFYFNSSLSQKVNYTLDSNQYGDFLYRITSSRSLLWEMILDKYASLDFYRKIFGNGYGSSVNITGSVYSHNDFIEILITHGIFGIIMYVFSFFNLFKQFLKNNKSKIILLIVLFVWLFNANFNMFYYYTCAVYSYPIFIIVVNKYIRKEMNL